MDHHINSDNIKEEDLVNIIWEGKSLDNLDHFNLVHNSFLSSLTIQSTGEIVIAKEVEECTTELQLVSLLKNHFQWVPIPQSYLNRFKKSPTLSTLLRERANTFYKSGQLPLAFRGYNLSLSFAPSKSPELALAFSNRSALFVQIKQYKLAIQDIDSALKNNFPQDLKPKLVQRRDKCAGELKKHKSSQTLTDSESKSLDSLRSYCSENFFRVKNPNPKIPNRAESWVEIDHTEDRGRRLIITEDVPTGTLILVDTPFVSVINNLVHWDHQHCHFCSKPIKNVGVPCELCTFTFYCDSSCRQKSSEGNHKYEHNYLSYIHHISPLITHRDLQALRIMGILGPVQLHKLFLNQSKLQETYKTYDCTSYYPIYNVVSHLFTKNAYLLEKIDLTFKALLLTQMLIQCSNFFSNSNIPHGLKKSVNSTDFHNFLSSLILHHLENTRFNSISISELKLDPSDPSKSRELSCSFATALYPLMSLCNHSCTPNVAPIKKFLHLETSLVTLKNLKKGQELFITYKPLFTTMKTSERLSFLKEEYNFFCKCEACLNNWSIKNIKSGDDLLGDFEIDLMCTKCQSKNSGSKDQFKPCESCVREHLSNIAKVDKYEADLYKGDELINDEMYVEALEVLRGCLEYFGQNFSPCYQLSQVALDLYKRALVRLVNKAQGY